MREYWIVVLVFIIAACIIVFLLKRTLSKDSSTDLSALMITTGVSLICSAFQSIKEFVASFMLSRFGIQIKIETEYAAIVCGFLLIVFGLFYGYSIKERIFVLNMLGIFAQPEISEKSHIKELKLADYKVKESIIDFSDVFQNGNMSFEKNSIIVTKIQKKCQEFVNRSIDTKACFTGMSPIPYTILAGNYLSTGSIKRYFEYVSSKHCYMELSHKRNWGKNPELVVRYPETLKSDSEEIVLAVSISFSVQEVDLEQFDYDIIHIGLAKPQNNVITKVDQLEKYCNQIVRVIEDARVKYPQLKIVHLAASIPSCVSEKLGEQFRLRSNRLPRIIAYHFMNTNLPKYPFGIVVCDSSESEYGQLITNK